MKKKSFSLSKKHVASLYYHVTIYKSALLSHDINLDLSLLKNPLAEEWNSCEQRWLGWHCYIGVANVCCGDSNQNLIASCKCHERTANIVWANVASHARVFAAELLSNSVRWMTLSAACRCGYTQETRHEICEVESYERVEGNEEYKYWPEFVWPGKPPMPKAVPCSF